MFLNNKRRRDNDRKNRMKFNLENSYAELPKIFYSKVAPTPVENPQLIILNENLANELGLNFSALSKDEQAELFSGNILPKNSEPIAQAYAGHQYGGFVILGEAAFVGDAGATEQQMIEQAKKVGAEVVIHTFEYSHSEQGIMPLFSYQPGQTYTTHHSGSVVYGRSYGTYSGTSTATTPGTYHTDYIPYQRQHYDYLASFWRRTRPPIFGVTLNPLPDELRTTLQRNSGAHVVLVVMDSPAFKANILKGDVIVQFAGKVVGSFQEILDLLPSHAGQKVKVLAIRGAQTLDIDVQLNE